MLKNFVSQIEARAEVGLSEHQQGFLDRQAFAETAAFLADYETFPDPATNLAVLVMSRAVSSGFVGINTFQNGVNSGQMLNLDFFPEGNGPVCAVNIPKGYLESVVENPIQQIARTAKVAESIRLLFQNYTGYSDRRIMNARQAAISAGATTLAISMAVDEGQLYRKITDEQKIEMTRFPNGMASLQPEDCNAGISVTMSDGMDMVGDPTTELLSVVADLDFISMTSSDASSILSYASEAIKAGTVSSFLDLEYYLRVISSQLFFQAVPKSNQGPKYTPIIPGVEDVAEYGINVSQSIVGHRESPNELLLRVGDTYQVNFGKLASAGLFTMLPKYRQARFN